MNGKIKDYVSRRLEEKQLSTLTFAEKIYSPSDNLLAFTCFLPIEDTMYKINYSRKNFDDEGELVGDFYLIGGRCIPCSIKYKIIDED